MNVNDNAAPYLLRGPLQWFAIWAIRRGQPFSLQCPLNKSENVGQVIKANS